MQQGRKTQSGIVQQTGTIQPPLPQATSGPKKKARKKNIARPSFDCSKARTPDELLFCRDPRLAVLDVEMVAAYNQALSRLPPDGRRALQQEHLTWFRNYSHTCNQASNDADRAVCVANFLSAHTVQLNGR